MISYNNADFHEPTTLTRKMRVSVVGSLLFSFSSISFTAFSTKPSGSGIGLSISRQMLMMQSINLSLAEHNVAGYHVTFRME